MQKKQVTRTPLTSQVPRKKRAGLGAHVHVCSPHPPCVGSVPSGRYLTSPAPVLGCVTRTHLVPARRASARSCSWELPGAQTTPGAAPGSLPLGVWSFSVGNSGLPARLTAPTDSAGACAGRESWAPGRGSPAGS